MTVRSVPLLVCLSVYLTIAGPPGRVAAQSGALHIESDPPGARVTGGEPKEGIVSLVSNPAGATAYLDGLKVGNAPMRIGGVPYGRHRVKFELPGYDPYETVVIVTQEEAPPLSVELVRQMGNLRFVGTPRGAAVTANGEPIGTLPVESHAFPVGTCSYGVSRPGFSAVSGRVAVKNGETAEIAVSLKPKTVGGAVWRSALVPGSGQYYSDKKGRGIALGMLQAGAVVGLVLYDAKYSSAIDDYETARADYVGATSAPELTAAWAKMEKTYDDVDRFHALRGIMVGAVVGVYALNLLDAFLLCPYRGEHLLAQESGGGAITAGVGGDGVRVRATIRF